MIYRTEAEFKEAFELETGIIFPRRVWEDMWFIFAWGGITTPVDDADLKDCREIWEKARHFE